MQRLKTPRGVPPKLPFYRSFIVPPPPSSQSQHDPCRSANAAPSDDLVIFDRHHTAIGGFNRGANRLHQRARGQLRQVAEEGHQPIVLGGAGWPAADDVESAFGGVLEEFARGGAEYVTVLTALNGSGTTRDQLEEVAARADKARIRSA